jgi:hypothetical protein
MRMVVGLTEDASADDVAAALVDLGATSVQSTAPAQPGVLIAVFPTPESTGTRTADPAATTAGGAPAEQELLTLVSSLSGVRYAEPDTMQGTQ